MTGSRETVRLDSADAPEVQRFDSGTLGRMERTPQGGYVLPADLTRAGIFRYPDGVEYRPPEEVARADSLATLEVAPVTLNHPPEADNRGLITPATYRKYNRGQALAVRWDASRNAVTGRLLAQDAELIRAVESGTLETSCGYTCRLDATPGTTPEGEAYDRVQRNIRYNHVAIVPVGRAHESGTRTAIRLDSSGNQLPPAYGAQETETRTMDSIRIDGSDYPLGTPAEIKAAKAAYERWVAKLDAAQAQANTALSTATARADAAEATVTKLKADLAQATDPARLDAAITARTELQAHAVAILGKDEVAKLDHGKLKAAIIGKVFPSVKLDGKDATYVDAMYDAAIATPRMDSVQTANKGVADALGTRVEARKDAAEATAPAKKPHEMPLAYSKDKQA